MVAGVTEQLKSMSFSKRSFFVKWLTCVHYYSAGQTWSSLYVQSVKNCQATITQLISIILTTPWRHTHKFPISSRDWFYDHIQSGQSPNAIEYHNLLGGCDTQSHLDFDPDAFQRRSFSRQSISHETACTMNVFSFRASGSFQKWLYIYCLLLHAPTPWTQTRKPRTVTTLATVPVAERMIRTTAIMVHKRRKKKRKKLRRSGYCHCSTDRSIQN